MKYEAMICDILISNHQISKSLIFALDTSACRLLLVFKSINIYMLIQVSVKRKESYLYDVRTCSENVNNVQLYLFVCVELTYLK